MRDLTPFDGKPEDIASWRRVGEQVEARLAASGIPPCQWLPLQSHLTLAAFREHARTCRSCAERERIAAEYERDEPLDSPAPPNLGAGRLAIVFTGVVAVGAGAVALLHVAAGVSPLRSIPVFGGLTLLLASSGRAPWLYDVVRYQEAVGLIRSERIARVVLALLGVACCVVGFAGLWR
jgi:hypothetical protein